MKQQISLLAFAMIIMAAVAVSSFTQGKKENNGKGNQKEQGGKDHEKGNGKDKSDKGNSNKEDKADKANNKGNSEQGNSKDKHGTGNDKDDKGNKDGNGKHDMKDGYKWNNETFGDRKKIKNKGDKVTICHKFNKGNEPAVMISVAEPALKAHLNHGDVVGECPVVNKGNYSDAYIRRRTDYYNVLQTGQEQVLYSKSILDYAFERLTGAKTQLVTLQRANAPAATIEQKKVLVVDLEQNVSVLQTLVGVTANMLANRWAN